MMQFLLLCFQATTHKDREPQAVFVHGSPVKSPELDRQLLSFASDKCHSSGGISMILNGTTDAKCAERNIAYPGFATWSNMVQDIRKEKGEGPCNLISTAEALHTAAECYRVIDFCKSFGLKTVAVMSQPHHLPRCVLQWVYCLQNQESDLRIVPATIQVDWSMPAKKPVLGGGLIDGNLFDHTNAEMERIVKYMNPDHGGKYTPHATLADAIAYLRS